MKIIYKSPEVEEIVNLPINCDICQSSPIVQDFNLPDFSGKDMGNDFK